MRNDYWHVFFQYCDSNIGLFPIAPLLVITLPTFDSNNCPFLSLCLIFPIDFLDLLFYAIKSDNRNIFAVAFKSENELQLSLSQ